MRYVVLISFLGALTGCAAMPQIMQDIDDMATDTAIKIEVDKEAIKPNTNVYLNLRVLNKEQPAK